MVSDVYHQRELNSQGKKVDLPAVFLLSTGTVLTKSIIKTQNSLLCLGVKFPPNLIWVEAPPSEMQCWKYAADNHQVDLLYQAFKKFSAKLCKSNVS